MEIISKKSNNMNTCLHFYTKENNSEKSDFFHIIKKDFNLKIGDMFNYTTEYFNLLDQEEKDEFNSLNLNVGEYKVFATQTTKTPHLEARLFFIKQI